MRTIVFRLGRRLLMRKAAFPVSRLMYDLSLRGLGILNYENQTLTGEDHFLRKLLDGTQELTVLDVGANVGVYSGKVKRLCPGARVYAFEPHPRTFEKLSAAALEGGFTAINLGLSNADEEVTLYDYASVSDGSSHASLYKDAIERFHGRAAAPWDARVTTLDSFLREAGIAEVDLLKIDTEGSELNVLRGARQASAGGRIRVVQLEFTQLNVFSRTFVRDFYEMLPDYQFFRMVPDGLVPMGAYNPVFCEIFAYQNVVAIHSTCKELIRKLS